MGNLSSAGISSKNRGKRCERRERAGFRLSLFGGIYEFRDPDRCDTVVEYYQATQNFRSRYLRKLLDDERQT